MAVAVGAGLVAVGAGLVGVDVAAGPWVGVGVASSPHARMKRVNTVSPARARYTLRLNNL